MLSAGSQIQLVGINFQRQSTSLSVVIVHCLGMSTSVAVQHVDSGVAELLRADHLRTWCSESWVWVRTVDRVQIWINGVARS